MLGEDYCRFVCSDLPLLSPAQTLGLSPSSLSDNSIDNEGAQSLAEYLSTNTALKELEWVECKCLYVYAYVGFLFILHI